MRRTQLHSVHFMRFACAVLILAAACGDAPDSAREEALADSAVADSAEVTNPNLETPTPAMPAASDPDRPAGSIGDPADAHQVGARVSEWEIDLTPDTIPAGEVTLTVTNAGERAHTIELRSRSQGRWRTVPIPPGGTVSMTMPLLPGSYQVVSTTPEYETRGMSATIIVR